MTTPAMNPARIAHYQRIFPSSEFSKEEDEFFKFQFGNDLAAVRFLKLHCSMCDEHIGSAPGESFNVHEHPVLRTLLCAECRKFYGEGIYGQGEDNTDLWCRWCANGGTLYCCSFCSNTFCSKCLKRNLEPHVVQKIMDDDRWKCLVCDPKDLYTSRSNCRALIQHLQTVRKLLENNTSMSPKEVEEKMNLDESLCCQRRRKRKRRKSISYNEEHEEEDPKSISRYKSIKHEPSPLLKRRKIQKNSISSDGVLSNGIVGRENSDETVQKDEFDLSDLLVPCEQTMEEGDSIIEPKDFVPITITPKSFAVTKPVQVKPITVQSKPMTVIPNDSCFNRVPMKKVYQLNLPPAGTKLTVANPLMLNSLKLPMTVIPRSSVGKPTFRFAQNANKSKSDVAKTKKSENIIDLESDDEPEVMETIQKTVVKTAFKNMRGRPRKSAVNFLIKSNGHNVSGHNHIDSNEKNISLNLEHTPRAGNEVEEPPAYQFVDNVPLKLQQRDQRFKKMLYLQSQEINKTVVDLKSKMSKLLQDANLKSNHEADLLESAAVCTKRFSRAIRKTLVELSLVNDRLVRDYVQWKKKFPSEPSSENKTGIEDQSKKNDKPLTGQDLSLEMTCARDSDSECDDVEENQRLKLITGSVEPSTILDHLTIFKKKICSVKAVGEGSVITEDKAVQVDDVPRRNYEKCIGYSLLSKPEVDPETDKEVLRPSVVPDDNFGKYQEHYIYHLQHLEDFGIETSDEVGLVDTDYTPENEEVVDALSSKGVTVESDLGQTLDNSHFDEAPPVLSPQADIPITVDHEEEEVVHDFPTTTKNLEELMKMVTKISHEIQGKTIDHEEQTVLKSQNDDVNAQPPDRRKEEETSLAVKLLIEAESVNSPIEPTEKGGSSASNDDSSTTMD